MTFEKTFVISPNFMKTISSIVRIYVQETYENTGKVQKLRNDHGNNDKMVTIE